MSENLKDERKLLNLILKQLDESGETAPDVSMEANTLKVKYGQRSFKITVEVVELN